MFHDEPIQLCLTLTVSKLKVDSHYLIMVNINMCREREKCVKYCLNIPVDSASGHGQ